MTLNKLVHQRLKEGGWVLLRNNGRHEVWKHPNGAICPILTGNKSDSGHWKANLFNRLRRLEQGLPW